MPINTFKYLLPGSIDDKVSAAAAAWHADGKVERLWTKDASVWTNDDEAKWLGWLHVVEEQLALTESYRAFQDDIAAAGFTDVLLMGMGGSSLCPEVLAMTFGRANFHILDSTVPAQVKTVEDKLDLTQTLFIVASKSGSTLEPNCFKQYFFERVSEKVGAANAGRHFVAITDPGSKMEQISKDDGFRHIFYGKPEIGGRFSALSAFGMTAAASMGLNVEAFLTSSAEMVEACKTADPASNPGAILGLILGICHAQGRDKLTIFTTPELHDVGAWLEQLVAESTGKDGVAIIPVDREPAIDADQYGNDRVFAFVTLTGNDSLDAHYSAVTNLGHPAVRIELNSIDDLGQEFFRWEFATSIAGAVMQINPFNQPDVESAKIEAKKITEEYEKTGSLPAEEPFFTADGIALFTGSTYADRLNSAVETRSFKSLIDAHVRQITTGDYFALLGYVEMNEENESILAAIRKAVLDRTHAATCLGFGPRFLHSTGQAYKGGSNNGVFLQITTDDDADLPVPGQKFTFGVVKAAQARGDFQVLLDRDRRALRVHLTADVKTGLRDLLEALR